MQIVPAFAQSFGPVFLSLSIIFIVLGLISFGWLVVHVEHSRHRSVQKMLLALVLGSIFIGFGIHFFLLSGGA
ncbi:MAG: hypothetical protein EAX95_04200 [Candidatus Thorarchaeota archaeon]|nr:hypothetical protein [Candidatus Thorarchaeota archaeon]